LLECFLAAALYPFAVEEVAGVAAAPLEDCGVVQLLPFAAVR